MKFIGINHSFTLPIIVNLIRSKRNFCLFILLYTFESDKKLIENIQIIQKDMFQKQLKYCVIVNSKKKKKLFLLYFNETLY